jgi:hypothetical protein
MLTRTRQAVLTRGSDGEEAGKIYRGQTMFHVFLFFIICRLYLFRTSPSYSASASQCFRFGVKVFNPSAPCWGPEKNFPPVPKPVFGVPVDGEGLKPAW